MLKNGAVSLFGTYLEKPVISVSGAAGMDILQKPDLTPWSEPSNMIHATIFQLLGVFFS